MNGQQIKEIKKQVCTELSKIEFRYDMINVSCDVEPERLTLTGLSECMKDLHDRENSKMSDYEMVVTDIKIKFVKVI